MDAVFFSSLGLCQSSSYQFWNIPLIREDYLETWPHLPKSLQALQLGATYKLCKYTSILYHQSVASLQSLKPVALIKKKVSLVKPCWFYFFDHLTYLQWLFVPGSFQGSKLGLIGPSFSVLNRSVLFSSRCLRTCLSFSGSVLLKLAPQVLCCQFHQLMMIWVHLSRLSSHPIWPDSRGRPLYGFAFLPPLCFHLNKPDFQMDNYAS